METLSLMDQSFLSHNTGYVFLHTEFAFDTQAGLLTIRPEVEHSAVSAKPARTREGPSPQRTSGQQTQGGPDEDLSTQ